MIDSNDPKLTAYVLGELDEAQRLEVEAAFESSPPLRREVDAIRAAAKSLEGFYGSELQASRDDASSESLVQKVLAASDAAPEDSPVAIPSRSRKRRRLLWAAVGTAAALCLVWAYLANETIQSHMSWKRIATSSSTASDSKTPKQDNLEFTIDRANEMPLEGEELRGRIESDVRPESWEEFEEFSIGLEYGKGRFDSGSPQNSGFDVSGGGSARRPDSRADKDGWRALNTYAGRETVDGELSGMGGAIGGAGMSSGMGSGMGMGMGGSMGGAGGMAGMAPSASGPEMPSGMGGTSGGMMGGGIEFPKEGSLPRGAMGLSTSRAARLVDNSESMETSDRPIRWDPENQTKIQSGEFSSDESTEESRKFAQTESVDVTTSPAKAPIADEERESGQGGQKPREAPRTWKRSPATPNASRLMIGDEDELPLEGMQANVVIDGFRARVLIDLYYYNDRQNRLEGSFQLRLPDEASPYYFAFGETSFEYRPQFNELASKGFFPTALVRESGPGLEQIRSLREASWSNVKEARVVPREKAAHAYGETVRRRIDPALVEWAGAGVFNARVFPLAPQKLHRIVVGYDVNLIAEDGKLAFEMALPEHRGECSVDLNVAALAGAKAEVSPEVEPFSSSGRAFYHYAEPKSDTIAVELEAPGAIVLTGAQPQAGDFFAARFTPDLPKAEKQSASPRAIFLVDTSLSSQPDRFNVWLKLLESSLNENRDSLTEFAVLFFNIDSHWYKPAFTANTPEAVEELLRYCHTLSLEGATDIHQALAEATNPSWLGENKEQPPSVDRFLFSDGAATWGETNARLISQAMGKDPLFAYRTGFAGTDGAALDFLASESGGAVFTVASESEIPQAAVAHRQRPYKLVAAVSPGGDDFLTAGRIRSIYPGQSVLLVGRGKPTGEFTLKLSRGEETSEVKTPIAFSLDSDLAARIYGQTAVGQLEDLQAAASDVATAYARHFRVTGQTCSLLMLDSEADYDRFQIKPEDDAFVVKSTPAAEHIDHTLDAAASRLADPKAMWLDWIERMARMPGGRFEASTALKVALEKMPADAFAVAPDRIACSTHARQETPKKYFEELQSQQPNYETILAEAERRRGAGAADSLRVLSNLIEANPGDAALAKDIAFAAMELGLPGQAWPLLKRAAMMRPYEPLVYQAMAQCLAELGRADLAIVFYEIAVGGEWNERYRDIQRIAVVDYLRLLRQIDAKKLTAQAGDFAAARRASLEESVGLKEADLVVTLMWSTDRTDVDLHVIEPTGEECFYQHAQTRTGASITRDVTEGFGPEMYVAPKGVHGKYAIAANFYGDDANRTTARTKVYVTICEGYGTLREKVTRKTVLLSRGQEKREVASVMVEK